MPKLSRDFKCAPEGHTTYTYKKGDDVDGRVAELAEKAGAIDKRTVRKVPPQPSEIKPAAPDEPVTHEPSSED